MIFLLRVFIFLFSLQSMISCEFNLWQQIIPLIQKNKINQIHKKEETLKNCIIQAIILHGDNAQPLDQETLQTLESLHIFSNILPKIARNNLEWGYFELARNACQITDQLNTLTNRNNNSLYLQNNQEIITQINEILKNLKNSESDFLLHFYFKLIPKETHAPSNPIEEGFAHLEELENKILSNRYTGGAYKLAMQGKTVLSICAALTTLYNFKKFHEHNTSSLSWGIETIPLLSYFKEPLASFFSGPYTTLITIGTLIGIGMSGKSLKADFDQAAQKQKSILLFKEVIKASKKIVQIINNHPNLASCLKEYQILKNFAEYKKHPEFHSEKMLYFLNLLEYYPFNQDEPSAYPLWQGKIYETFMLYEELKSEIVPLWQALGSLDAYLSIQNLLATKSNDFCIPEWIEHENPILDIKNYWHPVIPSQKAIKNSILLGNNSVAYNTIITGANAGGKTTAMTAIMISAILAQSLGIAAADSYQATPFTRMHTYLDITTNLSANESLFVAQANRAKHLYESIKSCNNQGKTLTILDEIFTGTRADFAEQASYEFAQKLAYMPHNIAIIATHFPKLTELEQTNMFVNYQAAPAIINLDGTLTYPYLIIPGISEQNIANIILKEKGILN